jgi:hypothetical protein
MSVDHREDLLFDVEPFDHRLNDPIALRQLGGVVVEVAWVHQTGQFLAVEERRPGFGHRRQAGKCQPVPHLLVGEGEALCCFVGRRFAGDDVEEVGGDTHIGQVGGDALPHHSRSEDGHASDSEAHDSSSMGSLGLS